MSHHLDKILMFGGKRKKINDTTESTLMGIGNIYFISIQCSYAINEVHVKISFLWYYLQ